MKQLLTLFLVLLSMISLQAIPVRGTEALQPELREKLEKTLSENLDGRGVEEAEVLSYETEKDRYPGNLLQILRLQIGSETYEIQALSPKQDHPSWKALKHEIERALLYVGVQDGKNQLDAIYHSTYSSKSLDSSRIGQRYLLTDAEGKVRGRLILSSKEEKGVFLKAEYVNHPKPGMKLRKTLDLDYEGSFLYSLNGSLGFSLSLSTHYGIYPFAWTAGIRSVAGHLMPTFGLKTMMHFCNYSDSQSFFIRNSFAGAETYVALDSGEVTGGFSIFLGHQLTEKLSLSAGYEYCRSKHHVRISLGGVL